MGKLYLRLHHLLQPRALESELEESSRTGIDGLSGPTHLSQQLRMVLDVRTDMCDTDDRRSVQVHCSPGNHRHHGPDSETGLRIAVVAEGRKARTHPFPSAVGGKNLTEVREAAQINCNCSAVCASQHIAVALGCQMDRQVRRQRIVATTRMYHCVRLLLSTRLGAQASRIKNQAGNSSHR